MRFMQPHGYVVVRFDAASNEDCELTRCPSEARWCATPEEAEEVLLAAPASAAAHVLMAWRQSGE